MTILNLMLGSRRGGLEQAAVDYAEALQHAGYATLSITAPDAWAISELKALPHVALPNYGARDIFAAYRLRRLARTHNATAVVCHGNRALGLALRALKGRVPVIATAHNYKTKQFFKADAAFCITHHSIEHLAKCLPHDRLYFMPNMVRIPAAQHTGMPHLPPVIGSMGRFVAKKGFPLLVEALSILNQRGVDFRAIIGGGGEEEQALRADITRLGLSEHVTLPGWVTDKFAFFDQLDLFVLPSHHEPFGIVLLEAMGYSMPVVATRSEGPLEIIHDGVDAQLVPLNDAPALADALANLLADPARARRMGEAARHKAAKDYSIDMMATRLKEALTRITSTP